VLFDKLPKICYTTNRLFNFWRCTVVNGHFSRCNFLISSDLEDCSCESSRYLWAFVIAIIIFLGELFGGFLTGSLALLSDAWHTFGDGVTYGIAFVASITAQRMPQRGGKIKTLATQVSAALLVGAIIVIFIGALERLLHPSEIHSEWMMYVALAGLLGNISQHLVLKAGGGVRDALHKITSLHVIQDMSVSAGVVVGGVLIRETGWLWIDPALSLVIAAFLSRQVITFFRTGEFGHAHNEGCSHPHHHDHQH